MNRLNALLTDELDSMQSALDLFISLVCVLLLEIAVPTIPQDTIDDSTQGKSSIIKELIVYPGYNENEFIDAEGNIVKKFVADKVILALDENMPIKQSLSWQRHLKSKTHKTPVFIRTLDL
jgi:hypothetical protein